MSDLNLISAGMAATVVKTGELNVVGEPLPAVRLASPSDETELMDMVQRLHAENGLFSFSRSKCLNRMRQLLRCKGGIVGVIGAPGSIQASIGLAIADHYYTDDLHLCELWNYVDEKFRRSRNAESLIEFAKRCAVEIKTPLIIGVVTNIRMAGKIRLYRRRLGYPAGAFFVHNGAWQEPPSKDDFWSAVETRTEKRQRQRKKGN